MHISKISLINYRNFLNAKFILQEGVNTIIGENGSGKTNLFRAIRLLLDDNMRRSVTRLSKDDFHRGIGDWRGHWIIISLEFDKISHEEAVQSLFLHNAGNAGGPAIEKATYNLLFRPKTAVRLRLSELEDGDEAGLAEIRSGITIADYETVFTGKSEADFNDPNVYKEIVGDFENVRFSEELDPGTIGARVPGGFTLTQEICLTFIQALRDVVAEFQNNRTNPLLALLKSKSGEIDPVTFAPIAALASQLNTSIEGLPDVQTLRSDITETIKDAAGQTYAPAALSIKSDLSSEADEIFQSLKLFIGESNDGHEGPIHGLSLGGANLIYLTLKLLEFKYQKAKEASANILLIEEPEAHIHTHIQKTLFDRLQFHDTQIIYSTHSTQISEVSNVRNVNILGKVGAACEGYQPTNGLGEPEVGNIQRYLDAVRSNLLFAKSVILVEGDAEEILIPLLIKNVLGLSLDEMGISLINIRSTGFKNVAVLFHGTRIRKKCAILTDLDAAIIDTTPQKGDSKEVAAYKKTCLASHTVGVARKGDYETFVNGNAWLGLFFAPHTFEVDFIAAGNVEKVVSILGDVYKDPATIADAKADLESNDIARYGKRILTMAKQEGKGWFAIMLGKMVDYRTNIPSYILDAVFFANPEISREAWFQILSYRIHRIQQAAQHPPEITNAFKERLREYRRGGIELPVVRNEILAAFPADQIAAILNRF